MVTAAMIAMFYLGTASGVVGAVLLGATHPHDRAVGHPLEASSRQPDELRSAA